VTEKKLLAILSLLLALIGGILVLVGVLNVSGNRNIDLDYLGQRAVDLILGIGAVLCGIYMYKGKASTAALLTIVVGLLINVHQQRVGLEGTLVLLGGVLRLLAADAS
jgi:1,4-dihydroxy-2-naphthoate octaprenyltransferase